MSLHFELQQVRVFDENCMVAVSLIIGVAAGFDKVSLRWAAWSRHVKQG